MDWGELVVDADRTFDEGPVHIMDKRDQVLQGKAVRLIQVLWQHRGVEKATLECEDTICANYPFLFEDGGTFFLVIDIERTVAYACDIECVSVCEFRGRNSFKGGECKTREKFNFFEKWQNGKLSLYYRWKIWKFSRSRMTKPTSLLNSSCEI